MLHLAEIHIYPIKSLGGVSLASSQVTTAGLQHDRKWMLVDLAGQFLTQREHAVMATLGVKVLDDGVRVFVKTESSDFLDIPFIQAKKDPVNANIWDTEVQSWSSDTAINAWFSEKIGIPCQLVFMDEINQRTRSLEKPPYHTNLSYADGYPILIVSEASVQQVSEELQANVDIRQFRPNLILAGGAPFFEDQLQRIEIGNSQIQVMNACKRCIVITTNQDTGERSKEPLRHLSKTRKEGKHVIFGMNAAIIKTGILSVGDELVELTETVHLE